LGGQHYPTVSIPTMRAAPQPDNVANFPANAQQGILDHKNVYLKGKSDAANDAYNNFLNLPGSGIHHQKEILSKLYRMDGSQVDRALLNILKYAFAAKLKDVFVIPACELSSIKQSIINLIKDEGIPNRVDIFSGNKNFQVLIPYCHEQKHWVAVHGKFKTEVHNAGMMGDMNIKTFSFTIIDSKPLGVPGAVKEFPLALKTSLEEGFKQSGLLNAENIQKNEKFVFNDVPIADSFKQMYGEQTCGSKCVGNSLQKLGLPSEEYKDSSAIAAYQSLSGKKYDFTGFSFRKGISAALASTNEMIKDIFLLDYTNESILKPNLPEFWSDVTRPFSNAVELAAQHPYYTAGVQFVSMVSAMAVHPSPVPTKFTKANMLFVPNIILVPALTTVVPALEDTAIESVKAGVAESFVAKCACNIGLSVTFKTVLEGEGLYLALPGLKQAFIGYKALEGLMSGVHKCYVDYGIMQAQQQDSPIVVQSSSWLTLAADAAVLVTGLRKTTFDFSTPEHMLRTLQSVTKTLFAVIITHNACNFIDGIFKGSAEYLFGSIDDDVEHFNSHESGEIGLL
jgi:hypothetical protein